MHPPESETLRQSNPALRVLDALRRRYLSIDVMIILFLAGLIGWVLLGQVAPGARLYPYSDRYEWALMPATEIVGHLLVILALYVLIQRFGVRFHREHAVTGVAAPKWLAFLNVAYVFTPVALIPLVFNLLGAFIAGTSGAPDPASHAAYDAAATYDRAVTWWDLWLKEADIALLGSYPAAAMRQYQTPFTNGVAMVCYISYYVSPLVLAVPPVLKRDWIVVRRVAAIYCGTLLLTYVGYILVPATGPRFEGGFKAWLSSGGTPWGMTEMQLFLDSIEIIRWDAFPSGHVAIALVTLVLALRYHPRVGWFYAPFVAGLVGATVFLGYHYVIDVLAGMLCALIAFVVIEPAVKWWEGVWVPKAEAAHRAT